MSFSAIAARAPNDRACFPCSHLGDLASGTVGTLVYRVISLSLQGRSLFEVALAQAGAACQVWWGRSHFGEISAEMGSLNEAGPQGECWDEHIVLAK